MTRYAIFALAALAACSGPDGKTDSGDTATPGGDCPNETYSGPVSITSHSVTCDAAAGTIRYYVETQGWSLGGRVFSQETSNTPAWSDNHDLESFEHDPCGEWDHLEQVVNIVPDFDDVARNDGTLFDCSKIDDPAVMSYAAEVDDINGNPVDCMAWGADPAGMIDGTASAGDRSNEPEWDLSTCSVM